MKRIFLFIVTNLAIVVLLSITLRLLGVDSLFTSQGINFSALLIFAAVFGMGGSFISLAISKWMAKFTTGAQIIETPQDGTEEWLLETVKRQAKAAGIGMPDVAIYDSPEVNAFATGMSRNNALVAVSSGLLDDMTEDEAEAVLAHEVSHVANGDMITLALMQGVINTFVIFLARILGYFADQFFSGDDEEGGGVGWVYFVVSIAAEIVLGILASTIVMWFSRKREFHADAGAARLTSSDKMIAALRRLQALQDEANQLPGELVAFGIASGDKSNWREKLFSSHPPLEERIAALEAEQF